MTDWPFGNLERGNYGVILADPPWRFATWNKATAVTRRTGHGTNVCAAVHYSTMTTDDIANLPVSELASEDCWVSKFAEAPISWQLLPCSVIDLVRKLNCPASLSVSLAICSVAVVCSATARTVEFAPFLIASIACTI